MSDESDSITSLLSHCTPCKSKCCKDSMIVHTQAEYDRIIRGGHPDHLTRVQIREGNFYVLNFKYTSCSYLKPNGQCSIEKDKSDTCRAYPAHNYYDENGRYLRTQIQGKCPASKSLSQEFHSEAIQLAKANVDAKPIKIQEKVLTAYLNRDFPGMLEDLGAVVTPPQKLKL